MAGAVDRLRGAPLAPTGSAATPWPRLQPLALASVLATAALLLHAALWGLQAPLGSAPLGGGFIAGAGLAWALWAAWHLRSSRPPRLLDEGPFRFGRNPLYLGIAVALAGVAAALGSPPLALAAGAFVLAVQRLHIPREEAALRRAFGGWYSDYCASVRRWL